MSLISNHYSEFIAGLGALGSLAGAVLAWLQFRRASASAANAKNSEVKLLKLVQRNSMSRDAQKIQNIVHRLSKHATRGQNLRRRTYAGLNLASDIENLVEYRNELASNSLYADEYKVQLSEILKYATSLDFNNAPEDERVTLINCIVEELSSISVSIDKEVSGNV